MKLIERNMEQIIALCEKHKVLQLYVFGSVLTDRFNSDSDIFALEDLLERDVDPVVYDSIKNPFFKRNLDRTKQLVYG